MLFQGCMGSICSSPWMAEPVAPCCCGLVDCCGPRFCTLGDEQKMKLMLLGLRPMNRVDYQIPNSCRTPLALRPNDGLTEPSFLPKPTVVCSLPCRPVVTGNHCPDRDQTTLPPCLKGVEGESLDHNRRHVPVEAHSQLCSHTGPAIELRVAHNVPFEHGCHCHQLLLSPQPVLN